MQPLIPPVVGGDGQPRDGHSSVLHLRRLLLKGHLGNEIGGARLWRSVGIVEDLKRILRAQTGRDADCEKSEGNGRSCHRPASYQKRALTCLWRMPQEKIIRPTYSPNRAFAICVWLSVLAYCSMPFISASAIFCRCSGLFKAFSSRGLLTNPTSARMEGMVA